MIAHQDHDLVGRVLRKPSEDVRAVAPHVRDVLVRLEVEVVADGYEAEVCPQPSPLVEHLVVVKNLQHLLEGRLRISHRKPAAPCLAVGWLWLPPARLELLAQWGVHGSHSVSLSGSCLPITERAQLRGEGWESGVVEDGIPLERLGDASFPVQAESPG